jgi:hypothetical protein
MTAHEVRVPYGSELEASPGHVDVESLGAWIIGACEKCGAPAVAGGEEGCPGFARPPAT